MDDANAVRIFALTKALELEQINKSKLTSSIERFKDPRDSIREQDVFSKLAQYSVGNLPESKAGPKQLPSDNKAVSPEEAMEELRKLGFL